MEISIIFEWFHNWIIDISSEHSVLCGFRENVEHDKQYVQEYLFGSFWSMEVNGEPWVEDLAWIGEIYKVFAFGI